MWLEFKITYHAQDSSSRACRCSYLGSKEARRLCCDAPHPDWSGGASVTPQATQGNFPADYGHHLQPAANAEDGVGHNLGVEDLLIQQGGWVVWSQFSSKLWQPQEQRLPFQTWHVAHPLLPPTLAVRPYQTGLAGQCSQVLFVVPL